MGFSKTHDELANMIRAHDRAKRKVAGKRKRKGRAKPAPRFKAIEYKPGLGKEFYSTRAWRSLRWDVLSRSEGKCVMCGHTSQTSGHPLHVDHIEARSVRPDLELHIKNLQVLCEDCNVGKGAKTWRPQSAAAQASTATPGLNPAPRYILIKGGQR
jgi:hypothetical protein